MTHETHCRVLLQWYPKGGEIVVASGYDESAVFDSHHGIVTLLYPKRWTTKVNAYRQSTNWGDSFGPEVPLDLGKFNDSLVGPGRGLQLSGGPHAGRLLFAAHNSNNGWQRTNVVLISDDHGTHWHIGATIPGMDEAQLAESGSNGTITIVSRVHTGPSARDHCLLANGSWSQQECTLAATSHDGGESFGIPRANFELFEPPGGCAPGFANDPLKEGHLFFSMPASRVTRERMVVRRSTDGARTWSDWREPSALIYAGPAAYSCLAPLWGSAARYGHRVGLLYERDAAGCTGPSCAIHFVPVATP
eukprot:SAG22_NODE_229_length_14598_cov_13.257052_2_plen_305_part_00